ncbi:MAG: outer membrane beta-barrel protein [Bacteroidaceae bacterium]|nr:outer membrane beta-barrel protein [Bacteroidaceae bacterium]
MKKAFLTMALVLTTIAASAQWYVGGGIGFSKTENGNEETTAFVFKPEAGYSLNEKWTIGAVVEFDWVKDYSTAYAINPYVRYSFFKAGNFSFFADGTVELGSIDPEVGDAQFMWGAGIKPGIGYSFTDHISIAAHIGWIGHRDYDDIGKETGISLDGNDMSFSIYYSF